MSTFPAKPLSDVSFLLGYVMDPLQFKGPHFACTIEILRDLDPKDWEFAKTIKYPVHVSIADGDNILRNESIKELVGSMASQDKVVEHYDSDHYLLSDGWLYESVVSKQLAWLDKILPAPK